MDRLALDGDAAELRAAIIAHGLVVIAGNVDQVGAFAHFAQELLQHVVMGLRPIDAAPDAPEVDDIADQINLGRFVAAQEIEEGFGLTSFGAEMNVGNKQAPGHAVFRRRLRVVFGRSIQHDRLRVKVILYQACDIGDGAAAWLTARHEP